VKKGAIPVDKPGLEWTTRAVQIRRPFRKPVHSFKPVSLRHVAGLTSILTGKAGKFDVVHAHDAVLGLGMSRRDGSLFTRDAAKAASVAKARADAASALAAAEEEWLEASHALESA